MEEKREMTNGEYKFTRQRLVVAMMKARDWSNDLGAWWLLDMVDITVRGFRARGQR